MKIEDARIGAHVLTAKGNHAVITGFLGGEAAQMRIVRTGAWTTGWIERLQLLPVFSPAEILEATLEAFCKTDL